MKHPSSKLRLPALAAFFALAASPALFAQSLINENFSANAADPNTVGWYASSGGFATFSASTGALVFNSNSSTGNNPSAVKQFTQTTLAAGETLRLTFDLTDYSGFATNNAQFFRVSLADTADTLSGNVGGSPWTTGSGLPKTYTLGVATGTPSGTTDSQFYYRSGQTNVISVASGNIAATAADAGIANTFSSTISFTVELKKLSSTDMQLSSSWTGGATGATTTATVSGTSFFDTFDTLSIGYGFGSSGRSFTVDNVNLSVTAIPEPSSYALALGGLAMVAVALRRRRR